eukprot:Gb_29384 [translate_table: standard]
MDKDEKMPVSLANESQSFLPRDKKRSELGTMAIDLRVANYDNPFVLTVGTMAVDTSVCDSRVLIVGTMLVNTNIVDSDIPVLDAYGNPIDKGKKPPIPTAYDVDGIDSCAEKFENTNVGITVNRDRRSLRFKRESCAPNLELDTPNFSSKFEVVHSILTDEREEGELIPTPDIEEHENIHCGNACDIVSCKVTSPNGRDNIASRKYKIRRGVNEGDEYDEVVEGAHDADTDDEGEESSHKLIEDRKNTSDVGKE